MATFDSACRAGDPRGCLLLDSIARTRHIRDDTRHEAAVATDAAACAEGDAASCYREALLYDDDAGTPRNGEKAFGLYVLACNAGYTYACARVGVFYRVSVPSQEPDAAEKAHERSARACNAGYAGPCVDAAQTAESEQATQRFHERGCAQGDSNSCVLLARDAMPPESFSCGQCADGDGDARCYDCEIYTCWVENCCETCASRAVHGCCEADYSAGPPHALEAEPRDEAADRAAKARAAAILEAHVAMLRELCGIDHAQSCGALGTVLNHGKLPLRDSEGAREAYTRGCDLDDAGACVGLADLSVHAESRRLKERARQLFAAECDAGHGNSCWAAASLASP